MTPPRDVRELVGDDLPPEELERLERVHSLILQAGPPPELPPGLVAPPAEPREPMAANVLQLLPRRRRGAALLVAAALVAAAFAVGYLVGGRSDHFRTAFVPSPMVGTADPNAFASLKVGARDDGGNWPVLMKVRGLPPLPAGSYYVLYVSKGTKPLAPCGSFRVHAGVTTVELSAAYDHDELGWDAWVVTVERQGQRAPGKVVMVTKSAPA